MATFFIPKSGKSGRQVTQVSEILTINAHDHAGNGLCLTSQPITVVSNALKGERCQVRYTKQSKRVNFAQVTRIIEQSALRSKPFCPYYEQCGGCSLQHVNANNGLNLKINALKTYLNKQLSLTHNNDKSQLDNAWEAPVLSAIDYSEASLNTGYRRRIRLAIDARNQSAVKIGFRANASQSIVDIEQCAIASDAINACLRSLRDTLQHLPSVQKVGHIIVTEGQETTQVALFSVQDLCAESINKLSQLGLTAHIQVVVKSKSGEMACISGDGAISKEYSSASAISIEDIDSVKLAVHSTHFLQVNKAVNQGMVEKAKTWLAPTSTDILYDFFCGSGNFALSFANHVACVKGYEGVAEMVSVASLNAVDMGVNNCDFTHIDLSSQDSLNDLSIDPAGFAILDPSREGALELCQFLATQRLQKILYVSCNPNSFLRDAGYLLPQYRLSKIAPLDMFPFTKHLELMALFIREC